MGVNLKNAGFKTLDTKKPPREAVFSLLLGRFDYSVEGLGIVLGQLGENLAVELDVGLVDFVHESGVVHAGGSGGGADAELPESAHGALLVAPVAVGVLVGLDRGGLRLLDLALAAPHEALGAGQQCLSTFEMSFSALYTRHMSFLSLNLGQTLDVLGESLRHLPVLSLHAGNLSRFPTVEVILASSAFQDLTGLGDFKSFCDCFVRFHNMLR